MKEVSIAEADRVVREGTWTGLLANVLEMTLWAEAADGNDGRGYDNIYSRPGTWDARGLGPGADHHRTLDADGRGGCLRSVSASNGNLK
jgi:hypothetical protein